MKEIYFGLYQLFLILLAGVTIVGGIWLLDFVPEGIEYVRYLIIGIGIFILCALAGLSFYSEDIWYFKHAKSYKKYLLSFCDLIPAVALGILIFLGAGIYYVVHLDNDSTPTLSQEAARTLVLEKWRGCSPDSCSEVLVSVQNEKGTSYVTAIYEGLKDDSVSAQKKVASIEYINGSWVLGEPVVTQKCWPDRGHQDFTAEPCI